MYSLQLTILFFIINFVVTSQSSCPKFVSVNITDDKKNSMDGTIKIDGITYSEFNYFEDRGTYYVCICNVKQKCIKKCCGPNEKMSEEICVNNPEEFRFNVYSLTSVSDNVTSNDFYFLYSKHCRENHIRITPGSSEAIFVQENGSLFIPSFEVMYHPEDYCIDTFNNEFSAYVCEFYMETASQEQMAMLGSGMIISMPFLLVTFLVYFILPERNVHRRALMNYVLSLLFGYISLVTVQLVNATNKLPTVPCHLLGYSIIFFFIVSFFWMNVMCIDMWLAFSGLRGFSGRKDAEKKKFILFCVYAWGMPSLLILLVLCMNTYADTDAIYYPQLGAARCFLEDGYPNLFYFYLPMAILITVNVILCILTTIKIQRVKKETSMLKRGDSKRHNYENDKQKFKLYLKLIFAMGVNWSMEVISWVVLWKYQSAPKYLWYITDFINAAYGIFIFLIFVCKKNVWYQLKKRYYVMRGKPHLAHTLSGTNTTRSAISTTENTVVGTDYRLNDLKNGRVEEKPLSG